MSNHVPTFDPVAGKTSNYTAKETDKNGNIAYSDEENRVWEELLFSQKKIVANRACPEFLEGLEKLALPENRIPQPKELSEHIQKFTGWSVEPVPALIPYEHFFSLLAHKKFPAASFIRKREEFKYLKEPDIFHELFGHCPMLTNRIYADFMQKYGELGLKANEEQRKMLARIYWFTVEFGLKMTETGPLPYGGGILSSPGETVYAAESTEALRKPFELMEVLRTPYRIDIFQPIYFVIDHFEQLYKILDADLFSAIEQAWELGEYPPVFSLD